MDDEQGVPSFFSCNRMKGEMLMAKDYEELSITDDFMFGKVMEDKELCREMLECLLEQPVGKLEEVQTERELQYTADGKPIRMDVYSRDNEKVYDAEMQNLNHRRLEELELSKRSRFYQAMMDADLLRKGNTYRKLPESRVLFLCTFDPFGEGLAKYTFKNRCEENANLQLKDGTEKIFFNCTCRLEDIPEKLKALYDYIATGKAESKLTEKLEEAVERARRNQKWRSEYMKELLHEEDIKEEALAQGREEKSRFTAINLYKMAMPTTQIAQAVGESLETVERWIEETRK